MTREVRPPQEVMRAFLASGSGELVSRLLTLALGVLAARRLEPREIGTLGLAVMLMAVISMIGYYAEAAAVVSGNPAKDAALAGAGALWRGAVTLILVASLLSALPILGGLISEGAAHEFEVLARPLLLLPVLESLAAYPRVLLQRRLRLRRVVILQFCQSLAYVGMGAAMLWRGSGVWGLAWAQLASTAVVSVAYWTSVLTSLGPGPFLLPEALRTVGRGTVKLFAGGFAGFLSERVDNFLIGGTLGPASMSFYSMAWTGSRTPVFMLSRALNAVLLPVLPRAWGDRSKTASRIQAASQSSVALMTLAGAGMFAVSQGATSLILGVNWLPLVPGLRIMSLTISLTPLVLLAATLLTASGHGHRVGIPSFAQVAVLMVLVPPLCSRYGVAGAALADFLATLVAAVILVLTVRVCLGPLDWIPLSEVVRAVICGILSAAATELIVADRGPLLFNTVARGLGVLLAYLTFAWPLGLLPTLRMTYALLRTALSGDHQDAE